MKRLVIFPLIASLITCSRVSQNTDTTKLDAYFDTLANNNRLMGSVAVSQNGKLIYSKTVGFADIEHGLKANENSKYRIASISKTFTTVLIFKAIEENRLNLNQTIDQFFPTIDNAQKITIENLLYHRSGIPDFVDNNWLDWNTQPKTEQEMVEIITKRGSDFEPDTQTDYVNSNFVLLSYILEKIYKKPYSVVLEEKIIKHIGLQNTYYREKINTNDNECNSYVYNYYTDNWEKETETDMSIFAGAGGIVTTPVDLTLFSDALFNGKFVSKNSLKQMETLIENIGMGLTPFPFDDKKGFGHIGGIDGFWSLFVYFPDDDISVAYAANGIHCYLDDVVDIVLNAIYNQPFEIPEIKTYQVTDEDLDKYLGIWVHSSEEFSIEYTITKANGKLILQIAEKSLPLEAIEKDKFERVRSGAIMEFNPTDKTMMFHQGGEIYNFVKKE